MQRPPHTVADVIREHGAAFLERRGQRVSPAQRRVLHDLETCRTSALGGHIWQCPDCLETKNAYNSCGNRHCPTCLGHRSRQWLEDRRAELLNVPYFHVVFTIPRKLAELALGNKKVLYGILFKAASQTLKQVASNPKHLGAKLGFLAVLHTWSQTLQHHPHVHCIVPAGGLSPDGSSWLPAARPRFLFPLKILSIVYCAKFLDLLRDARRNGQLRYAGATAHLEDDAAFEDFIRQILKHRWVVYCKPPFATPDVVLKYLALYTHRIAISNRRIVSIDDGQVTFRYRYRKKIYRVMTVSADEFLRRFLLHTLPKGFTRIRYFGWMSNGQRTAKLKHCRELTGGAPDIDVPLQDDHDPKEQAHRCPNCGAHMIMTSTVQPTPGRWTYMPGIGWDTS